MTGWKSKYDDVTVFTSILFIFSELTSVQSESGMIVFKSDSGYF